jgi:hypothetical protein
MIVPLKPWNIEPLDTAEQEPRKSHHLINNSCDNLKMCTNFLDFKLSLCSECHMLSSGWTTRNKTYNIQILLLFTHFCRNMLYIISLQIYNRGVWSELNLFYPCLTLSLLISYIYMYIELLLKPEILTSYVYGLMFGNAGSRLFLFAAQCFNTE